jgi:GWxTD domain-containing protein
LNGKRIKLLIIKILEMANSIKNISISLLFTIIIFPVVFISCKSTELKVDTKDLSYLYNPTKNLINPRYNVFNQSDESSILSVKFSGNDLFFSQANPEGVPASLILITVKLFNINQGKMLADTAFVNLRIVKETGRTEYVYTIPLKVEKGNSYVAEVKILDRLRLSVTQAFVSFDTQSENNRYNFRAQGHFKKNELFIPVLRVNEYVNLVYLRGRIDSLYISFFKPVTEVPDPPSMILPEKTLDYEPEKVAAIPYSDTLPIMFPRKGVYLFTTGRNIKEGFTFLNLGENYPTLTTPEVMIEPLSYLASANEMADLRNALKPKLAIDEFWIKCGGNIEKARELIRIYYTRVLYSNYYFTSYKEGWMTERGMIYIVYGPPDKIFKTSEGENWGYRKPLIKSRWGGRYSVSEDYIFFNFRKRESRFTDNDFFLSRSETLVTKWDQAVASWRKGIVFRLDNPTDF